MPFLFFKSKNTEFSMLRWLSTTPFLFFKSKNAEFSMLRWLETIPFLFFKSKNTEFSMLRWLSTIPFLFFKSKNTEFTNFQPYIFFQKFPWYFLGANYNFSKNFTFAFKPYLSPGKWFGKNMQGCYILYHLHLFSINTSFLAISSFINRWNSTDEFHLLKDKFPHNRFLRCLPPYLQIYIRRNFSCSNAIFHVPTL